MAGYAHSPYFFWKALQCETQVASVKFNPDGSLLATGDHDGNLTIWDTATGRRIKSDQPNQPLPIYDIAWSRDSFLLFIGQYLGRYTTWDVARGKKLNSANITENYISTVDMDSRGILGVIGGETSLTLVDIRSLNIISTKQEAHGCTDGFITASQFSRDGTVILSSGLNDDFKMWDKGSFRPLNLEYPRTPPVLRSIYFPEGNEILVTYNDKSFQVLDSNNFERIGQGSGVTTQSHANAAVDAGSSLLVASDDGCVHVICCYGVTQKLHHGKIVEIIECSKINPLAACVPSDEKRVFLWKYSPSW